MDGWMCEMQIDSDTKWIGLENFPKTTSSQDLEMLGGPLQDAGLCQRSAGGLASQCASFWNGNLSKWLRCVETWGR